jgi:hypothetical protein
MTMIDAGVCHLSKKNGWNDHGDKKKTWKFAADYIEPLHKLMPICSWSNKVKFGLAKSQGVVISPINITIGGSPCLDNTNQNSQNQSKASPNFSQVPTPRNALLRLSVPLPGVLALLWLSLLLESPVPPQPEAVLWLAPPDA